MKIQEEVKQKNKNYLFIMIPIIMFVCGIIFFLFFMGHSDNSDDAVRFYQEKPIETKQIIVEENTESEFNYQEKPIETKQIIVEENTESEFNYQINSANLNILKFIIVNILFLTIINKFLFR